MEGGQDNFKASDQLGLIWPEQLIAELAEERKVTRWSVPLAIANFVIAGLLALVLGPLQLILLVVTENYDFVNQQFYPAVLRTELLLMGVLAVSVIIDLVQIWRERPQRSLMAAVFNAGTVLIGATIWLGGSAAHLAANQLSLLFILIVAATLAFAKVTAKVAFAPERAHRTLNTALISTLAIAVIETGATGIFLLSQTGQVEEAKIALENLGAAQAAARVDGVAPELSDLVFTLCSGAYDPVHLATGSASTTVGQTENAGLFECRDTHRVYSVAGPTDHTAASLTGRAFYFGVTTDPVISAAFPPETGAKYLYRNLDGLSEQPSELVLLLPAASEEILVNTYLDSILEVLANRPDTNDLLLSIFYADELNNVITTKDYILIAAVNTVAGLDVLPTGRTLQGYLNGVYGTYIYTPDNVLAALTELGASPLLYSSQTREALNSHRHITVVLDQSHTYTPDELREILYAGFLDPTV